MFSECDPVQLQAATELGSLSQKRPALRDLTNSDAAAPQDLSASPTCRKTREAALQLVSMSPREPDVPTGYKDRWISLRFPSKLAELKAAQASKRHVFEIENRRLSHVGAVPTASVKSSPCAAKKQLSFRFLHEI